MITDQDRRHTHDITAKGDITLCGIPAQAAQDARLELSCDCMRPSCKFPLTCPNCKAVKSGKVS